MSFRGLEVKLFWNIYSEKGMSVDPAKMEMIKAWSQPTDKAGDGEDLPVAVHEGEHCHH